MASSSAALTEPREAWKPEAVCLWVTPAERWRRWLWLAACAVLPLGVGPALLVVLYSLAVPGNIGYIWLIGASGFTGILALTVAVAIRFEPQDVRFEITRGHIAMDEVRVPTDRIVTVRWIDRRVCLLTVDGTELRSRPVRPNDPDRMLRLIQGALPDRSERGDRPRGLLVPLLRKP